MCFFWCRIFLLGTKTGDVTSIKRRGASLATNGLVVTGGSDGWPWKSNQPPFFIGKVYEAPFFYSKT